MVFVAQARRTLIICVNLFFLLFSIFFFYCIAETWFGYDIEIMVKAMSAEETKKSSKHLRQKSQVRQSNKLMATLNLQIKELKALVKDQQTKKVSPGNLDLHRSEII